MANYKASISTVIEKAAQLLKENKIVAIPTETVYGLAANALNEEAVIKIFEAKKRPFFDPLIIHISSIEDVEKYALHVPPKARVLMETFWPGPLTLVLPKKDIVPALVTSGHPTVAMRMPAHPITKKLLSLLDFPLAAPSANPFGYVSPTSAQHVFKQLGNEIDYILDGGECAVGLESTIIGFEGEEAVLLRLGGIAQEEIEKITGPLARRLNQASRPDAPGQLSSHYAPAKPLFIGDINVLIKQFPGKRIGIISFNTDYKAKFPDEIREQWMLSKAEDLNEAARELFKALRATDETDVDIVLTEKFPDEGLGKAINDRLLRASVRP